MSTTVDGKSTNANRPPQGDVMQPPQVFTIIAPGESEGVDVSVDSATLNTTVEGTVLGVQFGPVQGCLQDGISVQGQSEVGGSGAMRVYLLNGNQVWAAVNVKGDGGTKTDSEQLGILTA